MIRVPVKWLCVTACCLAIVLARETRGVTLPPSVPEAAPRSSACLAPEQGGKQVGPARAELEPSTLRPGREGDTPPADGGAAPPSPAAPDADSAAVRELARASEEGVGCGELLRLAVSGAAQGLELQPLSCLPAGTDPAPPYAVLDSLEDSGRAVELEAEKASVELAEQQAEARAEGQAPAADEPTGLRAWLWLTAGLVVLPGVVLLVAVRALRREDRLEAGRQRP